MEQEVGTSESLRLREAGGSERRERALGTKKQVITKVYRSLMVVVMAVVVRFPVGSCTLLLKKAVPSLTPSLRFPSQDAHLHQRPV